MPITPQKPSKSNGSLVPMNREYTREYKDTCFYAWVEAGQPRGMALMNVLPFDEDGRKVNIKIFYQWVRNEGWVERADEINAKVDQLKQAEIIERRLEMFRRHMDAAQTLQDLAIDYIVERGIDSDSSAIRAWKEGVEVEQKAMVGADWNEKLAKMDNDELQNWVMKELLKRGEVIEGTSEDIEEELED